jgi:DNA-binding transcriptional LysR family regulator
MRSPYEVFLRIVECGSISKACAVLNVTQPALSRQLRKLEHELGAELFERTSSGVRLTVFGESLVSHAQTITQAQHAARQDVDRLRQNLQGHVTFGVSVTTSMLPLAAMDVLTKLTNLRMTIVEERPHALLELVRKRKLEFAVITSALLDDDASLVTKHLFHDDRLVVASSGHPCFHRKKDDFAGLLRDAWMLPPRGFIREWLQDCFAKVGLAPPEPQIETNSIVQMTNAIESGRFISVMPATAIRRQLDQGEMRPIMPEIFSAKVDIVAVYRAQHRLSRAARLLLDGIAAAEKGSNVIPLTRARKS